MLDHLMPLISSPWLYVIIFLMVAFDGFVPVVMSEAVIIGLGALSAVGSPNLAVLAGAAIAGGMAGDRLSYYVGRKASARIRNGRLAEAKVKAEEALLRQGGAAIVIGRFIPYGRTATTLTAGSVSLPLGPFYLASALSSLLWAAYSIGLGRLGGVAFAESPLLGAAFGIALGFLLAGLHGGVKRLRLLIVPAVARFRTRRRPAAPLALEEATAVRPASSKTHVAAEPETEPVAVAGHTALD